MSRHLTGFILLCFLFSMGCLLLSSKAHSQSVDFSYRSYGLEREQDNVIQNAGHLDDFFESLYHQKIYNNKKINIVHIGDSHIQADFLTNVVRRNFQQYFGNAGRGIVVPARLAGTNEPFNIRSSAPIKWNAKRMIYMDQPLPIGIGGITLQSLQPDAEFEVKMIDPVVDYAFNELTLFFQKDVSSFEFAIRDTTNTEVALINAEDKQPFFHYSKVLLPSSQKAVRIAAVQRNSAQTQATIFGLSLANSKPGVLYHAIGVNGAKYAHYNAALYFYRQTPSLDPEVFIISLGTNEAIDYPYLDRSFNLQIDKLVSALRTYNPVAKFILVTPPDCFRKKVKHNPGIAIIRQQIINYAVENGLAFYDMYKALGGDRAANEWKKAGLLRPDGVHFTKDGYAYQGDLLFNALMKSYNTYVPLRHP